jgi:glycerophosphoryl diester phosphodiesterase
MDALSSMQLRLSDGRPNGEPVPTLWRLLRHMPPDARLLVEIKPRGTDAAERVVGAIRAENLERRCVIQSFAEEHVRAVASLEPPLPIAWLIDRPERLAEAYRCPWPRINVRHDLLDEMTIRPLRRESKSVGVWTVNEELDIRRVLALGVDTIITDNPRRVRELVDAS